jgi:hypothetical protein
MASASRACSRKYPEHTERLRIHIMRALRALVTMRGRTIYAVLVG